MICQESSSLGVSGPGDGRIIKSFPKLAPGERLDITLDCLEKHADHIRTIGCWGCRLFSLPDGLVLSCSIQSNFRPYALKEQV